jgi:hypothetical protein
MIGAETEGNEREPCVGQYGNFSFSEYCTTTIAGVMHNGPKHPMQADIQQLPFDMVGSICENQLDRSEKKDEKSVVIEEYP